MIKNLINDKANWFLENSYDLNLDSTIELKDLIWYGGIKDNCLPKVVRPVILTGEQEFTKNGKTIARFEFETTIEEFSIKEKPTFKRVMETIEDYNYMEKVDYTAFKTF